MNHFNSNDCSLIVIGSERQSSSFIEMSLQVFLMIRKKQCSAKPTTGVRAMVVWAERERGQVRSIRIPRPLSLCSPSGPRATYAVTKYQGLRGNAALVYIPVKCQTAIT